MNLDKLNNISVPNELEEVKEEVYGRKNKEKYSMGKFAAAACLCLFFFGFTIPGYTKNLPIYSQIFEFFEMDNYQKVSTMINQEVTDKGITLRIVDGVYSGNNIAITFEIESDKLNGEEIYLGFDLSFKNVKQSGWGGGFDAEYRGDNTYVGYLNMSANFDEEPPKELIAKLKFNNLEIYKDDNFEDMEKLKGNWNFEIPLRQLEGKVTDNYDYVAEEEGYYAKIKKISMDDLGFAFTIEYWNDYDVPVWFYSSYYAHVVRGEDEIEALDSWGKPVNDVDYIELEGGGGSAVPERGEMNYRSKTLEAGDYKLYIEMRKAMHPDMEYSVEEREFLEEAPDKIFLEIPFTIE
ncbi:DUF4179 domain-containing protein [Anaerosphaera multitolerans]|uniref:DUF4179 domain-containing protein n=1 Tax=Anaerosphaera multitolerans TaxID=2487351 RepID=A0A437S4F5_9FIRM|nr:DUF4179 domain-containing protein [Anaerosphaera multitolerans]RVU53836.1 DUF4179 domain-containing protein [Anaerosphaera multitolerans]